MEFSELQLHKHPQPEIIKDEHVIIFLKEKKLNSDFGIISMDRVLN